MRSLLRFSLLSVFILSAVPCGATDGLPLLPAGGGPETLPSLSSSNIASVPMREQSFSATCYLGNPNDKQSLGSITVTTSQEAGINCNSMYFNCKGRCFGCYSDFDLSQDICVDNSGRRFLR